MSDVRSIVMDTSSRTSVALVRVLCARLFKIQPAIESHGPDLDAMLAARRCGAGHRRQGAAGGSEHARANARDAIEKIDLGEAWTSMTGLPFVWAFWAGRAGALSADDVAALQAARDAGVGQAEAIAREYFREAPQHQRDRRASTCAIISSTILATSERAGLELFYRYAAEIGVVPEDAAGARCGFIDGGPDKVRLHPT